MNAELIRILHARAVKAAQQWVAATPGTRTKERLWLSYEKAERAFDAALK